MIDVPKTLTERPATFWSLERGADDLGCSVKTIRRMIASGELSGYRIGKKMIRVSADEVRSLARRLPTANAS
jgi:excisionase family DNA binding protein